MTIRLLTSILFTLAVTDICAQAIDQQVPSILTRHKEALGLDGKESPEYTISDSYTSPGMGITHIYLEQRHLDIRVDNGILNLNMKDDQLISFGNRWIQNIKTAAPSNNAKVAPRRAVEQAAAHLGKEFAQTRQTRQEENKHGQVTKVMFEKGNLSKEDIPAELVWLADGKGILLCWIVVIHETDAENIWRIFIDAHTGAYVKKDNMVVHCEFDRPKADHTPCNESDRMTTSLTSTMLAPDSSYNVFAMPIESPNHGSRSIETRPWTNAGLGNDAITLGWHDNGTTNYTITRGNNVHAYEDINNDGLPGFNPDTANLRFDYPFDPLLHPEDNMAAGITNLFYWNNIIHDVMYQYGFDEPSGNFQVNNLGRGGSGADDVRAEGLDGGGLNNANFFTPADGSRPRMQMYLWSEVSGESPLTINSPEDIAGEMYAVESAFSNNNHLDEIGLTTGDLILVDDSSDTTHLACGTIANDLTGKIAVIDRGVCNFTVKVKNAQNEGAIAAIVINDEPGAPFAMGGNDNTIVIPAVMISLANGNILKAAMNTSTVNVSLDAVDGIIPDGDYDNGIITHEYGHGISIRLTGGPSQVGCLNNAEQMGEGWSDYFGLMLTTDWANASPTDIRGIGTYVYGQPIDGTGIRTYPYTTDTLVNPFTYFSIEGSGGSVHYIGSVWCTMLWDMTWKIIELTDIDPDIYHGTGGNNIALQLVMDALKLQPCSPGFVDGRNAILLADKLRYGGQYSCAIWEAFAKRGLGADASQGSSNSYTDCVESFAIPTGMSVESKADTTNAVEGQELTFTLKAICECEGKSDLEIRDILSEDLVYIPGSGGMLDSNEVVFTADTIGVLDTLEFSYKAMVLPCTAVEPEVIQEDDAQAPDAFQTFKLAGTGTRAWVKNTTHFVSSPASWYGRDYTSFCDYVLRLINPLEITGPVEVTFQHKYETEATYDGGVVEYSMNGTTWFDAGPYFIQNGYPSAITNTNSNLTGRDAFTGDSDEQFDTTGFVRSTIRLNLSPGDFRLRFRFACDGSVGGPGINGWYIDNIVISQLSGVVNETRVTSDMVFMDSLIYGVTTDIFEGNQVYVDPAANGNKSGISWENAMNDLLIALEIAGCRETDSVFVAEGTYLPNNSDNRETGFYIPDSTLVFGGFPEGGSSFDLRDPSSYVTMFSGDLGIENENSDNAFHVVEIDSAQQGVVLDGIMISHGNANGVGDSGKGAAVFCEGQLTLQNVTMNSNEGLSDGQLILIRQAVAHLILHDCTLFSPDDSLIKVLNTDDGQVTIDGSTVFYNE